MSSSFGQPVLAFRRRILINRCYYDVIWPQPSFLTLCGAPMCLFPVLFQLPMCPPAPSTQPIIRDPPSLKENRSPTLLHPLRDPDLAVQVQADSVVASDLVVLSRFHPYLRLLSHCLDLWQPQNRSFPYFKQQTCTTASANEHQHTRSSVSSAGPLSIMAIPQGFDAVPL